MPLARSTFRNKSRSPAPGAVSTSAFATLANRTPVFYPPSHYAAAAAGLVQPDPMPDFYATKTPDPQYSNADLNTKRSQAYLPPASPISYPTQSPVFQSPIADSTPVPSSSHLNRVSRLISRSPSRSSAKSPRASSSRANAEKVGSDRRQSQFVDIPLVEMQLIPTLSDTIDKMTHPPQSSARQDDSETESMDSGNFARWQASRNHYGTKSPSICLDDPPDLPLGPSTRSKYAPSGIPALPVIPDVSMSNLVRSRAPQSSTANPQQRGNSRMSQYIPPHLASNASNSPKPPLKSALRTQQSATPPMSAASVYQSGKSLRSVRSMTSTGPTNAAESMSDTPSRARCPSQASALKQPNSLLPVPKSKSKSRSNPATPQLPARTQNYATPQSGPYPGFGPRGFNDRSNPPRSARSSASTSDSDSEHVERLERSPRSGRLATNKISSSTEDDDKPEGETRLASRMRLPAPRKYATPTSSIPVRGARREINFPVPPDQMRRENLDSNRIPVGLGFRMSPSPEGTKSRFKVAADDSQDESVYDDSTDSSQHEEQLNMRQHDEVDRAPATERSVRARLLDAVRNHDLTTVAEGDSKRRQAALVGIVDSLRSQFGLSPADGRRSVLSQSESDPYYEEGLAIASSGDFRYGSNAHDSTTSMAQLPVVEEQWTQEGHSTSAEEESVYSEDEEENGYSSDDVDPPGNLQETPRWSHDSDPPARSTSPSYGSKEQFQAPRRSVYRLSGSPVVDQRQQSVLSTSSARDGRRRSNSPQPGPNMRLSGRSDHNSTPRQNRSIPEPEHDGQSSIPISPADASFSKRRSTYGNEAHRSSRLSVTEDLEADDVNGGASIPVAHAETETEETDGHEWEAFGIPRSLSYGASDSSNSVQSSVEDVERQNVLLRSESDESLDGGMRHVNSALSSAGDGWDTRSADGAFSRGASALFEVLATGSRKSSLASEAARMRLPDDRTDAPNQARMSRNPSAEGTELYDRAPRSPRPGSPVYEQQSYKVQSMSPSPSTQESWCSSLQPSAYSALLSRYGPKEMQRQQVIFELLMSEKVMVKRLRLIVQSFILPLRSQNSRSWLPGVPQDVARSFDWFEDIVNMHRDFERALKNLTAPWKMAAVVDHVATPLLSFLPKFEIYQPYLVRVDEIKEVVADLVADEQSEFGEYVRMWEQQGDCDKWTVERLLEEPITRLNSYPELFERLLGVTPTEHPDYLASISLLCSTKTIIHVMEEVRIREEEYDFVKDVASHLIGLPDFAPLANRERRLLHDGLVRWLRPVEVMQDDTPAAPAVQLNGKTLLRSISRNERTQQDGTQRSSRLASAIHNWHVRRTKSSSISSSASSLSLHSYSTASSSNATSAAQISLPRSNADKVETRRMEVDVKPLQAFVFSDLLVLATLPLTKEGTDAADLETSWQLLDDLGLSKILSITERHENAGRDRVISLSLIPVDVSQLEVNVCVRSGPVTEMTLVLPASDDDSAESFLTALQRCLERTIHYLSFPAQAADKSSFGPNLEADSDTHHSVQAILASGLPLPKSPSMQLDDQSTDRTTDPSEQEREERGWWSLRFQQVLREFQRQDKSAWLLS